MKINLECCTLTCIALLSAHTGGQSTRYINAFALHRTVCLSRYSPDLSSAVAYPSNDRTHRRYAEMMVPVPRGGGADMYLPSSTPPHIPAFLFSDSIIRDKTSRIASRPETSVRSLEQCGTIQSCSDAFLDQPHDCSICRSAVPLVARPLKSCGLPPR